MYNRAIIIIAFLFSFQMLMQAQVTIGSGEFPVKGAILDLKQFTPQKSGDVNSTKGLMLPRLRLSDLNSLQDISGVNTSDASEVLTHTGLMIYNLTKDECLSIIPGVYIWSGTKWNKLGSAVLYKAQEYVDNRNGSTETYKTGEFVIIDNTTGDVLKYAGEWMLENLRASSYDTDVTPSRPLKLYTSATIGPNPDEAYYSYPGLNSTRYAKEGYFYSATAALNGKTVNGFYDPSSGDKVPEREQQGICPNGWRIPTYEDWKLLGEVVTTLSSECLHSYPRPQVDKELGSLIIPDGVNSDYISKLPTEGGFAAYPSGEYNYDGTINSMLINMPTFVTAYPVPVYISTTEPNTPTPMYGPYTFNASNSSTPFHDQPSSSQAVRCVRRTLAGQTKLPDQIEYPSQYKDYLSNK